MSNAETCTLAEETARRFLKSVVIIDNEASFDNSDGSHSLDIQKLTCAFAEKDILCSVLKPCKDGLDAERYANMVCAADAAVLDWQMPQSDNKDKTSLCREIIRNVFHREKGKRPRLIFIYTGETITETLLEQLKKSPVDAGVDEFSDSVVPKENGVGLVVDKLHIIFVGKEQKSNGIDGLQPEAGGGAARVSVGELPNHLLHEYACLTDGILPDAAFNAVATVRENTGNLLSLFKKELDPAFVHHLLLISDLRDGEAYLHELLRDAMYSLSASDGYCHENLSSTRLRHWFKEGDTFLHRKLQANCSVFHKTCEATHSEANETSLVTPEALFRVLLEEKSSFPDIRLPIKHPEWFEHISDKEIKKIAAHDLLEICENHDESLEQFTRLHAGESDGKMPWVGKGHNPVLQHGTIIKYGDKNYYLCIMPACDLVRLKRTQLVPFLHLCTVNGVNSFPTLCLYDKDNFLKFKIPHTKMWDQISLFNFEVDAETHQIISKDKKFKVTEISSPGNISEHTTQDLFWVAKLKDSVMIELNQKIFANMSRIGGNDFEWIRRHKK